MKPIFVYVLKDLNEANEKIQKYEVGIVLEETLTDCLVNFVVGNRILRVPREYLMEFNPMETGDGFPKKVCNVCHRYLDTTLFSRNQNGKGDRVIRRPSCDDCRKVIDGVNMTNDEKRKWNKIKPELEIFECPICKKRTIPGLTSKVVLDHNHNTGKARGWICDTCNTGIGRFKDEVKLLERAIEWIEKDKNS